jgi:cellulose synthase/poly-beta-1,6-N-acetylglucosamine synthase-like glycosyltransferase
MTILAMGLVLLPVAIATYAYVVYPAVLWMLARSRPPQSTPTHSAMPGVTIVVPAYNEEHQIGGAIDALLAQDYPAEHRQILIVSDASSDRTDDIVSGYAAQGVELLRMSRRSGKTAAENASVASIRGEIVINTDASVRLHPAAVRLLVQAMSDPQVGVASTRDVSMTVQGRANPAEAGYVGYEMRVRQLETRAGGIVGASGSGYAIRSELHRHPVREDLSRDFSAALTAHRHGYRAVSVEDALCFVPRTASLSREYRRKVRTMSRGMDTIYFNRDLLDPLVHGPFAWKLLSHKIARWAVPLSGILALAGLVLLALERPLAWIAVAAAVLLAGLGVLGARWPDDRAVPGFLSARLIGVLAANLAVVHAAMRFLRGHHDHVWEPTRRSVGGSAV